MANLRATAQSVLYEARDGIAWIAFYKQGRGWGAACFWPDIEPDGTFTFEPEDTEQLREILAIDENAIFVNSYYHNLGVSEEKGVTRETLAKMLRWQYELQNSMLADAWQEPAPGPEPEPCLIKPGSYVYTPRFCAVKIDEAFTSEAEARQHGCQEPTYYKGTDCVILGKPIGQNCMAFAAAPKARSA